MTRTLLCGQAVSLGRGRNALEQNQIVGFNTIRYLVTWEAIEHAGPEKYDHEFVKYTIEVLKIIHKVGGLYVFMECHQDVWSRYSGGQVLLFGRSMSSGLNSPTFQRQRRPFAERSEVRSGLRSRVLSEDALDDKLQKTRCIDHVHVILCWKHVFPHLRINGQNIQTFLQKHHMRALGHLWYNVVHSLPEMVKDGTLLGFESLNEPNCGLVGHSHGPPPSKPALASRHYSNSLSMFPFGNGASGRGRCLQNHRFWPTKDGSRLVDPKGKRAWLSAEEQQKYDAKYGWRRSGWKNGECIFAGLKIWKWNKFADWDKINQMPLDKRLEFSYQECSLRMPNYFNQVSPKFPSTLKMKGSSSVLICIFINHFFVEYYKRFKKIIRSISPNVFMLMEPPTLEPPPDLKNDDRGIVDEKTIYCPHYYDGLSLLMKTWNDKYNVDTLGIMRGRYLNPVLGLVVGERAIRNCIKKQFCEIANECRENLGNIPVLMSETGMPFDMDGKRAYEDGRYTSQTAAIDALANALEGSRMHHTYWCYTSTNCHKWGDRWNNEDFSFWSPEDRDLAFDDDDTESASFEEKQCDSLVESN
ncbi:hypothetical protein CJJ09_003734 [Candidozyma auris]|nr:hypothetical protein CJJ09_003734 [[Candida] auris]